MAISGCEGLPDGALCPTKVNRGCDISLHEEDSHPFCDSCLRAYRHYKRNSVRSETPARNGENQDDDHETEGMSTSCDVILIHCLLMSPMPGTVEPVTFKNAALARFSSAQITAAKTVLWQESMHDVIGPVAKRRITATRLIEEANVLDILEALQNLDRAGRLPSIATHLPYMPIFTQEWKHVCILS